MEKITSFKMMPIVKVIETKIIILAISIASIAKITPMINKISTVIAIYYMMKNKRYNQIKIIKE